MGQAERVEQALAAIERSMLPELAAMIADVLGAASAARPGIDAEAQAARLRLMAGQMEALTRLVGTVAPAQAERETISA